MEDLKEKIGNLEKQLDVLEKKNASLKERYALLQRQISTSREETRRLQNQVLMQEEQVNHRSVRLALRLEELIDRVNRRFAWGKYSKKRKSSPRTIPTDINEEPMSSISYDSWYEDNEDYSGLHTDVKPIAFYLPQFHTFKENDEWWGKGFTEWTNTSKAVPRFVSHYQPREPHADIGYYDLSDWRTLERQALLARQHGIYGFCFYRYWFSGKTLMEKPLNLLLAHPEIDINYCLCWANENWTRKWDGDNNNILIGQDYENDSVEYIADLKPYLQDPRYIRVNGKPVIIIYRPSLLPDASLTFKKWREWARDNGIGEILIWIQRGCATMDKSEMYEGADAEIEFPPSGTALFDNYDITRVGAPAGQGNLIGYRKLVNNIIAHRGAVEKFSHKVFRGVTLGWDNSPRRDSGYWATWGFSLWDYDRWLRFVIDETRRKHNEEERFFFINAWNEWAEGTYLEPDKRFGYSSINVTARALFDLPLNPHIEGYVDDATHPTEQMKVENLLSRQLPLFPYALFNMYHGLSIGSSPAKAWDECNKMENPLSVVREDRIQFERDEEAAFQKLHLSRVFFDELPERAVGEAVVKRVAVHVHIFYMDMLPMIIRYLSNIPCNFDLFISIPAGVEYEEERLKRQASSIGNINRIVIKQSPNIGRDIAPLICLFGAELLQYDYIAHFHTKKSLHTPSHSAWAEFIYEHLLGSSLNVSRILRMLDDDTGLVIPPDYLMMPEQPSGWGSNLEIAQSLLDKNNISVDLAKEFPVIEFPQGSMFWARSSFLKPMLTLSLRFEDFPKEPIGIDGTIAHAIERLFCIWGKDLNLKVKQPFFNDEEALFYVRR